MSMCSSEGSNYVTFQKRRKTVRFCNSVEVVDTIARTDFSLKERKEYLYSPVELMKMCVEATVLAQKVDKRFLGIMSRNTKDSARGVETLAGRGRDLAEEQVLRSRAVVMLCQQKGQPFVAAYTKACEPSRILARKRAKRDAKEAGIKRGAR